uniref:DDE-1 domain-containing protein n=1 Tax=Phytophthora ramorum TaxID=164328 RepID=H3H3S5_PHYRM
MDQTSVCVDMTPHSTIEFVGARTVDVVRSATPDTFRASVFLCASATGRKLLPMVVFAGTPGAIVHDELKEDMHYDWNSGCYTVQAKAYCDKRVMIKWIDKVWAPDIQGPSVLALDSLKTHKMECIRTRLVDHAYTSVVYVPPGVTCLAQPMDIAVMKPFKDRLRSIYTTFVIENGTFTDAAQKRHHIAASVLQAWDEVDAESIRNGFLKAGLLATGPRDARGVFATPKPPSEGVVEES